MSANLLAAPKAALKKIVAFLIIFAFVLSAKTVRVGLYESEPAIFTDASGQPAGLYIDILNQIAGEEGWKIDYIKVTWAEGLELLEKNEIDIVCNMGFIPERKERFSFPDVAVLNTFSKVFVNKGSTVNSLLDLKDKSVAVLAGSTHEIKFIEFSKDFDLNIRIIPVKDHETAFAMAARGEADAALTKNITAVPLMKKYRLIMTPIVFNAQVDHFGMGPGDPKGLADVFNRHLTDMKADKNSVYYRSVERWIEEEKEPVPGWIWIVLSVMGAGIFLLIGMDILLKREVNRKTISLKKSEENLRITLESIGDGVIATDAEGRITMINKTAEKLTGWKMEQCAGRPMNDIFRIINAQTRESINNPADIVIKNGKTVGLANHTVLISKDGTEYQIADSAAPILDHKKNIHGVILVFSDVTNKYKTENEVRTVKEQFEYVLSVTNTGFDIIDEDFNVIYVDPNWITKIGDPKHKKCHDYFMGSATVCETCAIPKVLESGISEISVEHLAKENRIVEVHTIPLKETINGKKIVAEFNIDITEKQQYQNNIKKLNESLEQKVAERTRELEMSNRELESFAYSVSHDLRAPLRHINGFAASMEQVCRNCEKEALGYLKKISVSALEMGALIDDLLEYSKTGRAELNKKHTDMNSIINELKERFAKEERYTNAQFEADKLPDILCDDNLIRTVWMNLMENALKYSSKTAAPSIHISFNEKENEYEFFVKDNGAGFDPQYTLKLFGVFQRLHGKTEYEGTGIGLANARRIIERHGGSVRAESEGEGKGATFYFTIPKHKTKG